MAAQLGGAVEPGKVREFGYAEVRARGHSTLLEGIQDRAGPNGEGYLEVWMSHGDKVTALPPGFKLIAENPACPLAGMADESRGFYAVQFHPEVTHTVQGTALLQRFVLQIAGTKPDWVMRDHVTEAVAKIREQVGNEEVILGLSSTCWKPHGRQTVRVFPTPPRRHWQPCSKRGGAAPVSWAHARRAAAR